MNYIQNLTQDWVGMLNFYERPFRAHYIPAKIWEDLDRYRGDSRGLVNYFKKWRTKVECVPYIPKIPKPFIAVSGEYGPDERQISLILHSDTFDAHEFSDISWERFKYKVLQTHMHELVHFMQFSRRDDNWGHYMVPYKSVGIAKKDAERKYLSNFDEIQAYAHCVYLDFRMFRPNVELSTLLARCKEKHDSATLHYFMKSFDYNTKDNGAPRKILHQILKWERKYSSYKPK